MMSNAFSSLRAVQRMQLPNAPRLATMTRAYSSSATPGQSSNVKNPISSSPESKEVNAGRGLEDRSSDTADTRSTQSPISGRNRLEKGSEAHEGEEQTSTNAQIKNDPNMSTEAKRENVEKAGQKPLGPEDHQ
ncbi:hypothetical protein N7523_004052 [Penicillium sp. IBT 18751x]|nr:hypothetical protein N7523_004052 [Penicillium sp. IBT 18751x]